MASTAQLTQEQIQAKIAEALRVLKERGLIATCPRCGKNSWRADLLAYFVSVMPVQGVSVPPPHIPTLTLTCNICGSTQLYNLNILGITL
jgi:predicted nucleic-acid-binding Zn-ribbon protein